jgi:hypothetical protein
MSSFGIEQNSRWCIALSAAKPVIYPTQRIEAMVSRRFKLSGWLARPCRALSTFAMLMAKRGRSSVVEHQLPKLSVVGSIPIARSNV